MPTVTWVVSKDAIVVHNNSSGGDFGSGNDLHLPVGFWSNQRMRALLAFSYSLTGMTAITSAVLHLKTTSEVHLAFSPSPNLFVERITEGWSEGSSGGENSWSSSNAVTWANQPSCTTTHQTDFNPSTSENVFTTVDVTSILQDVLAAGVFYGLRLRGQNEAEDAIEFYSREAGSSDRGYLVITYETNNPPNAPTGLTPTGNSTENTLTPSFRGTFSDPDAGDTMSGIEVRVYKDDGTTLVWDDSQGFSSFNPQDGTWTKPYQGPALTGNTFYRWQARNKDSSGTWGAWSAQQRFKVNSIPLSPTVALAQSPTSDILTLTPTFQVTHRDPDATDTKAYAYEIILETSGGTQVWDSGQVSLGTPITTISKLYNGPALSWQTSYRWKARTKDSNGAWGAYSSYATFSTHTTHTPTSLSPTAVAVTDKVPSFAGVRGDGDDTFSSVQVQLYASNGTTLIWDSGATTNGVDSTTFSIDYGGTALTDATHYKWRCRATGHIGGTSAWSDLQEFETSDSNTPGQVSPRGAGIASLNPTFRFIRTVAFNKYTLTLKRVSDGHLWVVPATAVTSTTDLSVASPTTLDWNTQYTWTVQVSSDNGATWSPTAGPMAFTTDSAGVPTLVSPIDDAWETTQTPLFQGATAS